MFTGIIESLGQVTEFDGANLVIESQGNRDPDPFRIGESVAVNGCCLTVVELEQPVSATGGMLVTFNLSPETVARTTLGACKPGSPVNLERAMRADGRFGGHIVQGHVDARGSVADIIPVEGATVVRFRVPEDGTKYIIDKGSIAVDGISLTVVNPDGPEFDTWIIPHTLAETNLSVRRIGDAVNLEYDMIARYVERILRR